MKNDIEDNDPQKNFILTGWERLCNEFPEEMVKYLPEILPTLFKLIR